MLRRLPLFVALSLLLAPIANAATVDVLYAPGTQRNTEDGIRSDTSTRGADLAGMRIVATYAGGAQQTVIWQQDDPWTYGSATGTGFGLEMGGLPVFTMTASQRLTSLFFDSSTSASNVYDANNMPVSYGASLFDAATADEGTPGNTESSLFGFAFSFTGPNEPAGYVRATYSDAVSLGGRPPQGDLYSAMMLDFTGLDGGGFLGTADFTTDMDTLATAGDLVGLMTPSSPAPLAPVPLPAGLPLLLLGLGALRALKRK